LAKVLEELTKMDKEKFEKATSDKNNEPRNDEELLKLRFIR